MIQEFLQNKVYHPVEIDNNSVEGHGHTLSVKVVMPCFCQANCEFCFNKLTRETQLHDWNTFRSNLFMSLSTIFNTLNNRKISIDITGNEPTFNIKHFKQLMSDLAYFKTVWSSKIDKIVLTTNGYHLYECIRDMIDIVDIVNISLHSPTYEGRMNIFKTKYIPSNEDLKNINKLLNEYCIKSTSVAVINHECSFKYIVEKFVEFSKEVGFIDTRIRLDFTTTNNLVKRLFDIVKFDNETVYYQNGLDSKFFNIDGFGVSIYRGVPELIDYVIGVEMVIDDNGILYLDYNKKLPLNENDIKLFDNNIYIINNNGKED